MKRFKATTMGKPIIVGRKTWESFPKRPLPGRLNIVITRDQRYRAEGAEVVTSVADAVHLARARVRCTPAIDEVCVVGGGEIYRQALPMADRLYITHVMASPDGDTRFPEIDPAIWTELSSESIPAGEKDSHSTRFVVYARREQIPAEA